MKSYNVSSSAANSKLPCATRNGLFSTKCPICYVANHDVILRMSSSKDSGKVCVQFGLCFTTVSPYLIRRYRIFQSFAFSNSQVFYIPISAIAAAVCFCLNGGASTFNSFSFSRLISQFSSKGY